MPEQKSHGDPEGCPKEEKEQQEITELLKREYLKARTQFVLPSNLIDTVTAYLLLIYTVTTFGGYAYASGHKTTSEIVFYSLALFVLAPIAYLVYLKSRKKTEETVANEKSIWSRFIQSPVGRFVVWLGGNRIFKLLSFIVCIYMVVDGILSFPRHPRSSLAVVVFYMALFFALVILDIMGMILRLLRSTLVEIFEHLHGHLELFKDLRDLVGLIHEFLSATSDSYVKLPKNVTKKSKKPEKPN